MNLQTKKPQGTETVADVLDEMDKRKSGLDLLRAPFPPHQISKLPKPTKKQTDDVKADFKKGIRCTICGAWHHPDVVHLDYVGHAALTDRLLDADPQWSWEPVGCDPNTGLPVINGGLWIKLTVCGVSRYGFGAADGKQGGDAIKEMIGDALRNAAMRFGAALDLWHKGDLHADEPDTGNGGQGGTTDTPLATEAQQFDITTKAREARVSIQSICEKANVSELAELTPAKADSVIKKLNLTIEKMKATVATPAGDILDDEIPY